MPVSKTARRRLLILELRRRPVDRPARRRFHRGVAVDRLAEHVEDAPERAFADRHRDRAAGAASPPRRAPARRSNRARGSAPGCRPARPALRASARAPASRFRRARRPSPPVPASTVARRMRVLVHRDVQRVVDVRQRLGRELDVHDVPEHLDDFSGIGQPFLLMFLMHLACSTASSVPYHSTPSASAPPTISSSSLVIAAWRALFIAIVSSSISFDALSVALVIATSCAAKNAASVSSIAE